MCKNIFCCLECRNRHEQSAHPPNDVWAERNRLRCGFCQGQPAMEFQCRNDFALIMHLCQAHLPLHCKKCLTVIIGLSLFTYHIGRTECVSNTHFALSPNRIDFVHHFYIQCYFCCSFHKQFNSIGDFSVTNKCAHMNDVCDLQSPKENSNKIDNQSATNNVSNINYVTAVQKSSFEKSISDSLISLRNYSTILHTSNHPLYKTQSPDAMEKALVRQTSTPMHQNLMTAHSPESIHGQSCSSCMVSSSTSGQLSSINSSSDSDTSVHQVAKPNEIR